MFELESELTGKMYGELKNLVASEVSNLLTDIQERYNYFRNNDVLLNDIIQEGAVKAKKIANKTLLNVYEKIGFVAK